MPVSVTSSWYLAVRSVCAVSRSDTLTLAPSSEYLSALETRLFRIWLMRLASP